MSTRAHWNERYEARRGAGDPAAFVAERAHLLPSSGAALDVAGGAGRHAVWLARRGLEVTLLDVSDVALSQASAAASAAGVTIETVCVELEPTTVPDGGYAVIVAHHFLDRDVWAALPGRLAPGGVLLVCQPTVRNLERHPRPSARWLLQEGELEVWVAALTADDPGLEVIEATEGWTPEGRHEARLVVRRRR